MTSLENSMGGGISTDSETQIKKGSKRRYHNNFLNIIPGGDIYRAIRRREGFGEALAREFVGILCYISLGTSVYVLKNVGQILIDKI